MNSICYYTSDQIAVRVYSRCPFATATELVRILFFKSSLSAVSNFSRLPITVVRF